MNLIVGEYEVLCAEYCGVGHYAMRAKVLVQSEEKYEIWLEEQETFSDLMATFFMCFGLKTVLNCSVLQLELSILEYNKDAPFISEVISYLHHLDFAVYDIASHFYWNNRLNHIIDSTTRT